jgi:integrase
LTRRQPSHPGITVRHSRACASRSGPGCNCKPTYQAHVWHRRDGKRIRKTFPTLAEAKAWRAEAATAVRKGTMRAPTRKTLREAFAEWQELARSGVVRNRSRDPYKPATIRGYEKAMRLRVLDEIGDVRLSEITRNDLQDLADRWLASGLSPSTVACTITPLQALYRRALARGDVSIDPTAELELPAIRRAEQRIADPVEAAKLIAALKVEDRALWSTALYGGLRRGELRGLRWADVDLASGVIRVERGWDDLEGEIAPKSHRGRRKVPIAPILRDYLTEHRARTDAAGGFVFGEDPGRPFRPEAVTKRAKDAWESAELAAITLHQCRHTFASLMIAAGVNAKALSTYMGHANIGITINLYGHLMPGNEAEAAGLLTAYLDRATAVQAAEAANAD